MNLLAKICRVALFRSLVTFLFKPKNSAKVEAFGLEFKNPVGLAAGFDKNALYLDELEALGFGFVEIGTVTPIAQSGNEKPRLFRLPKDSALINRMGFNNDGADKVAERLKNWYQKNQYRVGRILIGGNIGKNKITDNENAWKDYESCFNILYPWVDYFVINVSSPNTPGLRALQNKEALFEIINPLLKQRILQEIKKPILLKISPDLSNAELDIIIETTLALKIEGLIISNTTIERSNLRSNNKVISNIGSGGLSGLPVRTKSDEIIRYVHKNSSGQISIIGSGGIFSGKDAQDKIDAGAKLIEVWTGFVYNGPTIVKNICNQLNNQP